MPAYRGKDVVVTFAGTNISGDGRSVSIEGTADTLDTSSYGTDARTKIAGMTDASGSFEGLDTTGNWTAAWSALVPGATGALVIQPEGPGSSFREITATAIITSRSLSMPYDDVASLSVSFEISGDVVYGNQPV